MIKNVNELPALERIEQLQSYSQAAVLIITFFCLGVLIRKWIRRDEGTSRLLLFLIFFLTFGGILISSIFKLWRFAVEGNLTH